MNYALGKNYEGRVCEWCQGDTRSGYARLCSEACVIWWGLLMRWTLRHEEGNGGYHDSLIGEWITAR